MTDKSIPCGLNCGMCGKPIGTRPSTVLMQHRAEGIYVVALCSSEYCYKKLGSMMSEGKR